MKDIRILLCEDDPSLGRLLSDYLKAKGFEVTWAQDGVEGLKAFHRDTFDFIVAHRRAAKLTGREARPGALPGRGVRR